MYLAFSEPATDGTLQVNPNATTGRATSSRQGEIDTKLLVPKNWAKSGPALVVAFTRDGRFTALAPVTIVRPTQTPVPTAAPKKPPTATLTPAPPPTAAPKRPTATVTSAPAPTAIPPTAPPPIEPPAISIDPGEGPAGAAIKVSGQHWPAGQSIILALAPTTSEGNAQIQPQDVLLTIPANRQGQFVVRVKMPGGKRWEQLPELLVVAATKDGKSVATSRFVVVPPQPPPPPPPVTTAPVEPPASPTPPAPAAEAAPPATVPVISLSPMIATAGVTLTVTGQGWPKGKKVTIALAQPVGEGSPPATQPLRQAVKVDDHGEFAAQVVIPPGQGWEGLPEITIVAYIEDQKISTSVVVPNQPAPPAGGG